MTPPKTDPSKGKKQSGKGQTNRRIADQSAQPTAIADWKKKDHKKDLDFLDEEGFIAELPSGNMVRMRRSMDMSFLLSVGKIPNPLAGIVQKMIDTRTTEFPPEHMDDALVGIQMLDLIKQTVVGCVVEPPFAMPEPRGKVKNEETGKFIKESPEQYQERCEQWECPVGHISIFDMELEDQVFVFAVAQGAAADLAAFREQSKLAVGNLPVGKGVRKPTKRTGGAAPRKKK